MKEHDVIFNRDYGMKVPIYHFTKYVDFEETARQQAINTAKSPFAFHHVAIMPDVHAGYGSTVGTVIATKGAVMPAAVGVDIGCGMTAARFKNVVYGDLMNRLQEVREKLEAHIPSGFGAHGHREDGTWGANVPNYVQEIWWSSGLEREYIELCEADPKLRHPNPIAQLGTLGAGNHFVELCSEFGDSTKVWVMLHSGSRGAGNKIGTYFTKIAQELCARWFIDLPHQDLAYLPAKTEEFDRYMTAVKWAQKYAYINRELMLNGVGRALAEILGDYPTHEEPIRCHHNYIAWENHFGENVMVTRKGAVRARIGDLGIIPGSMGAKSYIVRGLGNPDSFTSCSHGAGRVMSRGKARATITVEQHAAATAGVVCDKSADTIDESPAAYKNIDAVLASEKSLVEPIYELKQFVCVKGKS